MSSCCSSTRIGLELLRLRGRPLASLPVLPFRRRCLSVTRLTIESSNIPVGTHDSAHTDLNPVALLVIPHMLSVHSKCVLCNDGVKVACVAYLLTIRTDFKQPQVFLWLAFCRNTPTDTTPCTCKFQLSPRLRCTAQYNASPFRELFIMHSRLGLVYSHSFVLPSSHFLHLSFFFFFSFLHFSFFLFLMFFIFFSFLHFSFFLFLMFFSFFLFVFVFFLFSFSLSLFLSFYFFLFSFSLSLFLSFSLSLFLFFSSSFSLSRVLKI